MGNFMKLQTYLLGAIISLGLINAAKAEAPVKNEFTHDFSVGFFSNYVADGVSQTNNNPSVQVNWLVESTDFYTNVFVSNLSSEVYDGGEIDFGLGKKWQTDFGFFDLGLLNNVNIALHDLDTYFYEIYAGVEFNQNMQVYVTYSDDENTYDAGKFAKVTFGQYGLMTDSIEWHYQLGYADMFRSKIAERSYVWGQIGASITSKNWTFGLDFTNTNISRVKGYNISSPHFYFSAVYSF
jgi:uncharacterized protein (TIGR02001 family)